MDNAAKALLMAGGMLLAILLLTLLIYAWSLFSEYQNSKNDLSDIENTAKFNQQFTNYDRDDVQGYELITLVNQIIDYNERKTQDTQYDNNVRYNPIQITININEQADAFAYEDKTNRLISNVTYKDGNFTAYNRTSAKSSFENNVLKKLDDALQISDSIRLDETKANKVAKNIGSIFHTETEIENLAKNRSYYGGKPENVLLDMANTYIASTGENISNDAQTRKEFAEQNLIIIGRTNRNNYYERACIYYEYMQFKRGVFKCTNLTYDDNTGRVAKIDFEFTGKIH